MADVPVELAEITYNADSPSNPPKTHPPSITPAFSDNGAGSAIPSEIQQRTPPEGKKTTATSLINNAFARYKAERISLPPAGKEKTPLTLPQLDGSTEIAVREAFSLDREESLAELFRLLRANPDDGADFFSPAFTMEEAIAQDRPVLFDEEGQYLNYYGVKVSVNPPVEKAFTAKEAVSGCILVIYDDDNNALGFLDLNLPHEANKASSPGIFYRDAESLCAHTEPGEETALEDVSLALLDTDFQAELKELTSGYRIKNQNQYPLFARARLRRILNNKTLSRETARLALENTPQMAFAILQHYKDEDVPALLDRVWTLSDEVGRENIETAGILTIFNSRFAGESAGRGSPGFDDSLRRLGEDKSRRILKEFLMLEKRKDPQTRKHDLKLALKSITRFNDMVRHAWNMSLGLDFNPDLSEYHPRQMLEVLGFAAAHPEAPALAQTLFEWTLICEIALQKKSQYYGRIQELKREFYRRFRENQVMADTAPTGDTPLEIERITKLAAAYLERDDVRKHPGGATLVLLGCDNCLRVENEVIKRLKKEGFSLGRIIGIDIGDVADEIPPDLGVHFIRKDLKDVTLADIFPGEKMSRAPVLAVAPWSMICDFFEKEGLLKGLKRISSLVGDNGAVILDVPLPFGDHSYAKALDEQAENFGIWGLMAKGFKTGQDQAVYSLFHIMPPQELLYDLANTGFLPVNVPADLQGLTRLTDEIGLDDSPLARQHTEGSAGNPIEHPFWQTGNGLNRVTVLAEKMTEEDILQKAGVAPSLLMKLGFGNA